jgi:hypothetical protein
MESSLHRRCNDQLRNPHASLDSKRLVTVVYEDDLDFSAIVGVDGTGRIEHGDAMSHGEARARPHLALGATRQCNADPRWDQSTRAGRDDNRRIEGNGGKEIESGRELALVGGERQIGGMGEPHQADVDRFHRLLFLSS